MNRLLAPFAGVFRRPGILLAFDLAWAALGLLAMLMLLALLTPVLAADGAADAALVWTPLINVLIEIGATLLMALLGWLLVRLGVRTNVQIDESVRAYLRDGLERAIDYGYQAEERRVRDANDPALRSEALGDVPDRTARIEPTRVVEQALEYALRQMPAAVAHFSLTPDRVRDMLTARLPPVH